MAKIFVLLSFLIFSVSVSFGQCEESYGKSITSYSYNGKLGMYGIATSATFCQDGTRYAKAEALNIVELSPGPNAIRLIETHYDEDGVIRYEGYLEIRFGFGGSVIKEERISGYKKYKFFDSWPSSTGSFGF